MLRAQVTALLIGGGMMAALVGCNFAPLPQGDASPTVEQVTLTVPPVAPSPTQPPTSTAEPIVETSTPTPSPLPPSETPTPSETPGPYEHTIEQGETLGYIIQRYGYRDFGVISLIVTLNPNVPNADSLPGPGSVILIPRQTATPTPEAAAQTETAGVAPNPVIAPTNETGLNVNAEIVPYTVLEGDTIVGIAANWATTLEVLARLNPDIGFFGCNFEIPSGGPNCNPSLSIGQTVNVPAPTPTPTLSPTPSGQETPTPTPTYEPPVIISPPQDAVVPPGVFRLEWVSAGALLPDEVYLVQIEDATAGTTFAAVTRDTSFLLPDTLIPADGQPHTVQWTVAVARRNEQGRYAVISGAPVVRRFQWQSR
jgi:hypothetical protein